MAVAIHGPWNTAVGREPTDRSELRPLVTTEDLIVESWMEGMVCAAEDTDRWDRLEISR